MSRNMPPAVPPPPRRQQRRAARPSAYQALSHPHTSLQVGLDPDTESKRIANDIVREMEKWLPDEAHDEVRSRRRRKNLQLYFRIASGCCGIVGLFILLVGWMTGHLVSIGTSMWSAGAVVAIGSALITALASMVIAAAKSERNKRRSEPGNPASDDFAGPLAFPVRLQLALRNLIG